MNNVELSGDFGRMLAGDISPLECRKTLPFNIAGLSVEKPLSHSDQDPRYARFGPEFFSICRQAMFEFGFRMDRR